MQVCELRARTGAELVTATNCSFARYSTFDVDLVEYGWQSFNSFIDVYARDRIRINRYTLVSTE